VLHRLLRHDPGSAAAGPARPGVEGDLEPEAFGFPDNMGEELPPLGTHELHRASWDSNVHLHDDGPADTGALHRLKVGGEPLTAQVAVHPHPVDPGAGRVRRVDKSALEVTGVAAGEEAQGQRDGWPRAAEGRAGVA
jgi:hypothetical protein